MNKPIGTLFALAIAFFIALGIWHILGGAAPPGGSQGAPSFLPVWYPVMILCAGLLGFFFPSAAWLVGPMMLATQSVLDVWFSPYEANLWPIGVAIQFVLAIPLVLSGLGGRFLTKRIKRAD
jgi:hypothetical protein